MVKWRGTHDTEASDGAVEVDNFVHWIMLISGTNNLKDNKWNNPHIGQGKETASQAFVLLIDDDDSRALELIAKDIVILRDNIKAGFAFKKGTSGSTISGIGIVAMNGKKIFPEKKNPIAMPFSKEESNRPVPSDAYMFPIIAAFGTMLEIAPTKVKWKRNPHELWANETLREKLVSRVKDKMKKENTAVKVKTNKDMFELLCQDIVQFQQKNAAKAGISEGPEYKII